MVSDSGRGSRYKKLVVVVPLVLLVIAVVLTQTFVIGKDPSQQLQLLGYNYGIGLSVTLSNPGQTQFTIQQVTYDGKALVQGEIGGALPAYATNSSSTGLCNLPTNDLLFPQAGHWNMDTGGVCSATIPSGADPTFYLGVPKIANSTHTLGIDTQVGNYTFTLVS